MAEASSEIAKQLLGRAAKGETVLAFWPLIRSEPDIRSTLEVWQDDGVQLCLPRVEGAAMTAHRVDAFDTLLLSEFGTLEPDPALHEPVELSQIARVLVPGMAFTADGVRLGRGGGHYDRFLAQLEPATAKIGVAFSIQLWDELPSEAHDIPVDEVLRDLG